MDTVRRLANNALEIIL